MTLTKKILPKTLKTLILASSVGLCGLAACGDDTTGVVECDPHDPHAPGCDDERTRILNELPEGGEIRLDYIHSPFGLPMDGVRGTAFAITDQTTPRFELPPTGVCADIDVAQLWPFTQSEGRVYEDLGESLVVKGVGASTSFTIDKAEPGGFDDFARIHDTFYFKRSLVADAAPFVNFGGEMQTTLSTGETYSIFMPQSYTVDQWATAQDVVYMPPGEDFDITWTQNTEAFENNVLELVTFFTPDETSPTGFRDTHTCNGGINRGAIVVDGDTTAALAPSGFVGIFNVTHEVVERNGRRFDLLALNCHVLAYTTVAPE